MFMGQRPRGSPSAVWALSALSTTTTEAINREPHRVAKGAHRRLRVQTIAQRTPAVAPQEKNMAVAGPIFNF